MADYKIIWEYCVNDLNEKVTEALNEGYLLTGGVCFHESGSTHTLERNYLQAVYKPNEVKIEWPCDE